MSIRNHTNHRSRNNLRQSMLMNLTALITVSASFAKCNSNNSIGINMTGGLGRGYLRRRCGGLLQAASWRCATGSCGTETCCATASSSYRKWMASPEWSSTRPLLPTLLQGGGAIGRGQGNEARDGQLCTNGRKFCIFMKLS